MKELEELKFKGNDPGAVQHGNFINYYKFHPPEDRIKLLPKDIWKKTGTSYYLDVGCNAGDLTMALNLFLEECGYLNNQILGIDIDPVLIERANEKCSSDKIKFECVNIMDPNSFTYIRSYLENNKLHKFDVITCFSITMWIHLNNGDDGLRTFLRRISDLGKVLVIEPQPWKCYKTAIRRMKRSGCEFPYFTTIKFRESIELDIERILTNECKRVKMMETDNTKWGRKLLFFH